MSPFLRDPDDSGRADEVRGIGLRGLQDAAFEKLRPSPWVYLGSLSNHSRRHSLG